MGRIKICGEAKDIMYDKRMSKLNLQLIHVTGSGDKDGHYQIQFEDWSGKGKTLFTLHIKEAIELKAMIDTLVYEATSNYPKNDW